MQNPDLPKEHGINQNKFSGIQQIDSLNVVAIGDTGLIMRTFDGGVTWQRQNCNTLFALHDVHFSDSLTGIIVSEGPVPIHTTTDGGRHWIDAPFHDYINDYAGTYFNQCHSYGGGKFRAFRRILGPIYTTNDNWDSIDSTKPLIDTIKDPKFHCYDFEHCNFSGGDTMIAYGIVFLDCRIPLSLLMRSTDAGKTWRKPIDYNGPLGIVTQMTSLDRDTILAGGDGGRQFLMSTDRGITWNNQNLIITNSNYPAGYPFGLCWAANGHPVASYTNVGIPGNNGILIRGDRITNRVEMYENIVWNTFIYPNPATTQINIISPDVLRTVHIYDMLGREVLKEIITSQGKAKLDVSSLSPGIYAVAIDHFGRMLPVGKVAVLGK